MYAFFRNGKKKLSEMFKMEMSKVIMEPFIDKLDYVRLFVENIIFTVQFAFIVAVSIAIISYLVSLTNLLFDYKTQVLKFRKGDIGNFKYKNIEIKDGSNFPGYIISYAVAGFIIQVLFLTVILSILFQPLFWIWLWF